MSMLGRLFGRQPTDPADALIDWLTERSLNDRRLVLGVLFGGPHTLKVYKWILSRPDCDIGSASMALWNLGRPDITIKEQDRFPLNDSCKRETITLIVDRWRKRLFAPAVFAWDNREHTKLYRRELKKRGLQGCDPFAIPEEAWQPVTGIEPVWSDETSTRKPSRLNDIRGALRLADLAAVNPADREPIRRKSLGLD